MLIKLFKKYESLISYAFFGVCTTIVNIVAYYLFAHILKFGTASSTAIAWFLAVLFALITNKIWVFKSKSWEKDVLIKETISFFSCRLLTGLLDILIMIVFVDVLHFNDIVIKVISNILVIILNYVASKLIIFNSESKIDYKKYCSIGMILLVIFAFTFIISMESALNPWNVTVPVGNDSNVFRSIANYMLNGLMPYRDLFDHKGPIIYLINYFGIILSPKYGIWVLEFIFMFITIYFIYKSASLLLKGNHCYSLLTTFIVCTPLFSYFEGGNLTEEYALPFIAISLYVFLDYYLNKKVNTVRLVICGMCCAMVFLLRVNMATLWVVFCIAIFLKCVINKEWKELTKFVVLFTIGFSLILIATIVWLNKANALGDFINCYFSFNGMYSSGVKLYDIIDTVLALCSHNIVMFGLIGSILIVSYKKDELSKVCLIYFVFTILLSAMSGRKYYHYAIIYIPMLVYPISVLLNELKLGVKNKLNANSVVVVMLTLICIPSWVTGASHSINQYRDFDTNNNTLKDTIDYKISEYIKNNTSADELITVYGNENEVYLLSQRKSASKYTYQIPIINVSKSLEREYFNDLKKNNPKYIVIEDRDDRIINYINKNNYEIVSEFENEKLQVYRKQVS